MANTSVNVNDERTIDVRFKISRKQAKWFDERFIDRNSWILAMIDSCQESYDVSNAQKFDPCGNIVEVL